ncbi:MAG: ABC transporter ATP-binding protein, partial [Bacteroidota bacterium]
MNANIAISVEGLSKRFLLGRKKESSLAANVVSVFSKKQIQDETEHWALRDINFKIEQGDVVGIVGKNGAGKSTLLKILSQITRPTNGRIEIHGRVASLLEVGTGFHPELTGRENIYLNGTILGMTRKEVRNKFEEIVSFSGVEKF